MPTFKVEIDGYLHACDVLCGAWKEVPTKLHNNGISHVQMIWMVFQFVTYCVMREFDNSVIDQTVLQVTPYDKCDKERTAKRRLYANPKCQAFHRSLPNDL